MTETTQERPRPVYPHAPAMTEDLPDVVRDSVREWEKRNGVWPDSAIDALRWDGLNGCYCFTWRGVFYGVEKADGHIHT